MAVSIGACLVVSGRPSAQSIPMRRGPGRWLTVGLSAGYAKLVCDSCSVSGRTFGPSAQVAFGLARSRNLRLGVEAIIWSKLIADDGVNANLGWIRAANAAVVSLFAGYLRSVGGRSTIRRTGLVDGQATEITNIRDVDTSLIRVGIEWRWGAHEAGPAR